MTSALQVAPAAPADPSPALRCTRLDAAGWRALPAPVGVLGALGWGLPSAGPALAGLDVALLAGSAPRIDAWHANTTNGPLRRGRSGAVQWQTDGHWSFGHVDVPDAADLAAAAHRAYLDVFTALRGAGTPHPLRLWNYLPRINEDGGGLERYRQFNIGRQRAFIDSGHDAFEGAPAACALGTQRGGLSIRFLAGRTPPRPLENPRQVPAYRYSADYGPRSPTFSRAALADAGEGRLALFVSGTASIVGERSVHAGDVHAQLRETVVNLEAVIAAARAQCTADFRLPALECSVYVRHARDASAIRNGLAAALGADAPAVRDAVFLEADICRSELLVEIEGHAFATGALVR